jgi:UTP-glucose-1-phosphate uridylyltransferase/mevalonate kinase
MKLFVPGRICLFGEHSDWAGGHRRMNAELKKGYTIITGTNQGIYAEVTPHANKFIFKAALPDGTRRECELPMEPAALLEVAEEGGFFSHVAGVAYQIHTHYRVHGLVVDNYKTDLPVKKGLSSSAAACVLVARAFNRTYDLKMTIRGEMEFAYLGEITTPSRCGRMDQGCAYGSRPVMMTYDAERLDVQELSVPRDLYLVIVDLMASKDTKEILKSLNMAYPFASNDQQRSVQEYLGPINARITAEAADALNTGDAARIGALMKEAQAEFDAHLQPACPSQLTAPVLHRTLAHAGVQPYVLGGKGVGSQGDGTAQFIVKDEEAQQKAIEVIERELGMECLALVMRTGRRVRKALIPAAGFGTRLFPATKAIKKELFPVVGRDGRAKPVILHIVEEALSAGIEQVAIIVQRADQAMFEEVFKTPPPIEFFNKLSKDDQKYCQYLLDVGHRITFLPQDAQEGFGHAVYCAREWVAGEPFLLLLGDHLYASDESASCAQQLLDCYDRYGKSVVGVKTTAADEIKSFGTVTGTWDRSSGPSIGPGPGSPGCAHAVVSLSNGSRHAHEPSETPPVTSRQPYRGPGAESREPAVLHLTEFAEKPDLRYAREHLHVDGMADDEFLTVFGQYVLRPAIFEYLEEHITHNIRERGEFQLTSCLERLRQEDGFIGYVVRGRRFDIGLPHAYRQTVCDFGDA